jgi:squalene-hopene/tetraprenyl-beta-curcumene cyclase
MKSSMLLLGTAVACVLICLAASKPSSSKPVVWNAAASAKYQDDREVYWQGWEHAARDPETQCVSCHTQVPYALSRPLLRGRLQEKGISAPEQKMLADIGKRVSMWDEIEPFYSDPEPTREPEARGTESVLNALILTCYDAEAGHLTGTTKKAFDHVWDLQIKQGTEQGSWTWLNFQNEPWESADSAYQGATFVALAVGMAPDAYQKSPSIQPQLALLRAYLKQHYVSQSMENKLVLLWASAKLPGLLTLAEQRKLANDALALQQTDGGWSLTSFGNFKRHDSTELETKSDGYATGLAVLAIEDSGVLPGDPKIRIGLDWLSKNQNQEDGSWAAYSLNKKRDPKSNVGHFMTDAATGFAIGALADSK